MGSEERVELSEERQLLGLRDGDGSVVRCSSPNLKKAMGANHWHRPMHVAPRSYSWLAAGVAGYDFVR